MDHPDAKGHCILHSVATCMKQYNRPEVHDHVSLLNVLLDEINKNATVYTNYMPNLVSEVSAYIEGNFSTGAADSIFPILYKALRIRVFNIQQRAEGLFLH